MRDCLLICGKMYLITESQDTAEVSRSTGINPALQSFQSRKGNTDIIGCPLLFANVHFNMEVTGEGLCVNLSHMIFLSGEALF